MWSGSPPASSMSPLKYTAMEGLLNELVLLYTKYSAIVKTVRGAGFGEEKLVRLRQKVGLVILYKMQYNNSQEGLEESPLLTTVPSPGR